MLGALLSFLMAQSVTYLREGAVSRALLLLVLFPVQLAYGLAIVPHIAQGVSSGLRYAVNTFIITPKKVDRPGLLPTLIQQRAALSLAGWMIVGAFITMIVRRAGYIPYLVPLLMLAGLIVAGVMLVPVTERLRNLLRARRPALGERVRK